MWSKITLLLVLAFFSAHTQATKGLHALASNPLLRGVALPRYAEIKPQHIEEAVQHLVSLTQEKIAAIESDESLDFAPLFEALDEIDIYFSRIWSPLSTLHLVNNHDALHTAYHAAVPAVTALKLQLAQNPTINHKLLMLRKAVGLDAVQQRMVQLRLIQARTLGGWLRGRAQQFFNEISTELEQQEIKFGINTLNAIKDFQMILHEQSEVVGLPPRILQQAAEKYQETTGKKATANTGPWLITLDYTSYEAFMEYSEQRALRRKLHHAYNTIATQPPYDNTPVLKRILQLRQEKARLLDFSHHADLQLSTRIMNNIDEVHVLLDNLQTLTQQRTPRANHVHDYLAEHNSTGTSTWWDMYWWGRKAREDLLGLSIEELRRYFPFPRVLDGLFTLLGKLFSISIKEATDNVQVWHPDVKFYQVYDDDGTHIASFYLDPYSRVQNRSDLTQLGLCNSRHVRGNSVEIPVCNIITRFTPPTKDSPALLDMYEVSTLFHEFGHAMHELLTKASYGEISGTRGVEYDAIEVSSELMSKFIYLDEVMPLISAHVDSGEPLPTKILARLRQDKDYYDFQVLQNNIWLSQLDLKLHTEFNPYSQEPIELYRHLYEQLHGISPYDEDFYLNSFGYIFSVGFDVNLYSYLWGNILATDIFEWFKTNGFDDEGLRRSGSKYRDTLLAAGGSKFILDIFTELRGREPSPQALLKSYGLVEE